jgi:transcriptional regulator with XRE-family HTH domain
MLCMIEGSASRVPEFDQADRMRKALREAGIGVQEMADYLEVSRTTVSNWINGRHPPSKPALKLWAIKCDVDHEWLRGSRRSQARTTAAAQAVRPTTADAGVMEGDGHNGGGSQIGEGGGR